MTVSFGTKPMPLAKSLQSNLYLIMMQLVSNTFITQLLTKGWQMFEYLKII